MLPSTQRLQIWADLLVVFKLCFLFPTDCHGLRGHPYNALQRQSAFSVRAVTYWDKLIVSVVIFKKSSQSWIQVEEARALFFTRRTLNAFAELSPGWTWKPKEASLLFFLEVVYYWGVHSINADIGFVGAA